MFRCMVAGTTTAAMLGLTFGIISSKIWGTAALPFIIGSSLGFTIGSARWYTTSTFEALNCLDIYPALLRMHLLANFPRHQTFRTWPLSEFRAEVFERSWVLRSMLVAGWLTARPALDDIHDRKEAALVEAYTQERTAAERLEICSE
jgi:hypothetical protein